MRVFVCVCAGTYTVRIYIVRLACKVILASMHQLTEALVDGDIASDEAEEVTLDVHRLYVRHVIPLFGACYFLACCLFTVFSRSECSKKGANWICFGFLHCSTSSYIPMHLVITVISCVLFN